MGQDEFWQKYDNHVIIILDVMAYNTTVSRGHTWGSLLYCLDERLVRIAKGFVPEIEDLSPQKDYARSTWSLTAIARGCKDFSVEKTLSIFLWTLESLMIFLASSFEAHHKQFTQYKAPKGLQHFAYSSMKLNKSKHIKMHDRPCDL